MSKILYAIFTVSIAACIEVPTEPSAPDGAPKAIYRCEEYACKAEDLEDPRCLLTGALCVCYLQPTGYAVQCLP